MKIQTIVKNIFMIGSGFIFIWLILLYFLMRPARMTDNGKIFSTKNLVDLHGNQVELNQILEKENTIIDFWYLGCKPCLQEMKNFPEILENHQTLNIASVSVDGFETWQKIVGKSNIDSPPNEKLKEYITKNRVSTILQNDNKNWKHYNYKVNGIKSFPKIDGLNVSSYPTYYMLDKDGKILRGTNSIHDLIARKESAMPEFYFEAIGDLTEGMLWKIVLFFYTIILLIIWSLNWLRKRKRRKNTE